MNPIARSKQASYVALLCALVGVLWACEVEQKTSRLRLPAEAPTEPATAQGGRGQVSPKPEVEPGVVIELPTTAGAAGESPTSEERAVVYAHGTAGEQQRLYAIDPIKLSVRDLGSPECEGASKFIDLAVDRRGTLFLVTVTTLYRVLPDTLACSVVGRAESGAYPTSLSFVPGSIFGEQEDVLVGFDWEKYVRVDPVTGVRTQLGTLGLDGYVSSGDVVSVKGGRTLLTASGPGSGDFAERPTGDYLVEVDPKTGHITANYGPTGIRQLWGLTQWGGRAFAFSAEGRVVELILDGGTMTVNDVTAARQEGISFYGAGSTTLAPPVFEWPVIR